MNSELFLTIIKLINVVFCLFIIGLIFWHNSKHSVHSIKVIISSIVILILLVFQVIYPSNYDILYTLVLLFVILLLLIDNKSKSFIKPESSIVLSEDLITQAKEQERSRIYANLHDDVGAKLLELIYTAKDDESKSLAKHILNDIRKAVASTVNIQCHIDQLANEIIEESETRLRSSSIEYSYKNQLSNPKQNLTANIPAVISRICREVISNIIKHSQANHVKMIISSTDSILNISIVDNGIGFNFDKTKGKGLKSINKRALSISSMVKWETHPDRGTNFSLVYNYGNQ